MQEHFKMLLILCASILLISCGALSPEEQMQGEARERVEQEARNWGEVQRIWRQKEKEGQGCEGEVLRDDGLRNVVVGKRHALLLAGVALDDDYPLAERRVFEPDGTLPAGVFEGEYEVIGSLVCTRVLRPENPIDSCFRLIRSREGKVFEERLVASGVSSDQAKGQDLSCIELEIADIGGN